MKKTTGTKYLAKMLEGYGVTNIFFVPAILRGTLIELEKLPHVHRVRVNSEKSAAYMADGYARASGKPGLCMAQNVGALNIAAGLRDAYLASSPVIAITGGRHPLTKFKRVYQEADDLHAFDNVTKFNATVDDVSRIPDLLRQAFRVATSGTPGPVHLQFQGNEGQIDLNEAEMELIIEDQFTRVPPFRPQPEDDQVLKLAKILENSQKPIIVAGKGVKWSNAGSEVVKLAEKLQIPVATSLSGKDIIPGNHSLLVGVVGWYSRKSANRVMQEADLVFYIGSQAGGMTSAVWQVPQSGKKVVQLDIDPESLGKHYPLEASILGDAKISLQKLIEVTDGSSAKSRKKWIERTRVIIDEWKDEISSVYNSDDIPMRPERICKELTELLPMNTLLVSDTGHSAMWTGGFLDLNKPDQSYLRSGGHLGWAFPASLGAKCACPERPVFCFTGDAGFLYHIGEIETAIRWNIKTIVLVNNNHAGNQSKGGFRKLYGGQLTEKSYDLWGLGEVNYAKIAESFGGSGIRVERPGDLKGAIEKAISMDRFVVIDIVTDDDALAPLAFI